MWVNPPSTTLTWIFWLNFPSHPRSIFFRTTLPISIYCFLHTGQQNKGKCVASISALQSPIIPPPQYLALPLPIYPPPRWEPWCAETFRITACRWRNISLVLRKIFSPCSHLVFPLIFLQHAQENDDPTTVSYLLLRYDGRLSSSCKGVDPWWGDNHFNWRRYCQRRQWPWAWKYFVQSYPQVKVLISS